MNLPDMIGTGAIGLLFVLIFFGAMIVYGFINRRFSGQQRPRQTLRAIPAFIRLAHEFGQAVEAGKRLHISLGWGGIFGLPGAAALVGLSVLERITRIASISDRPPVATSGDGTLAVLSQDTLRGAARVTGALDQVDFTNGQLTGLTPFSYAAGTLPIVDNDQVSASIFAGHFGSEIALITDAAERSGSLTLGGSDSIPAQSVLYATAQEPLIGEELYAAGAYVQAGLMHTASLHAQDVLRWVLVIVIVVGVALKLAGVL